MPESKVGRAMDPIWTMQINAASLQEPSWLVKVLTGAILGCGGWVLSRGASDAGTVHILFEFERAMCLEIYSVLMAAGLELSHNGHRRFTELCQCTRCRLADCESEIASIDLEIEAFGRDVKAEANSARLA